MPNANWPVTVAMLRTAKQTTYDSAALAFAVSLPLMPLLPNAVPRLLSNARLLIFMQPDLPPVFSKRRRAG